MKNYTITVNGNVYDVTVEENGAGAPAQAAAHILSGKSVITRPFSLNLPTNLGPFIFFFRFLFPSTN